MTPEQIRLVVDVDGIGELDAVARLDTHPAAGDRVSMVVDASRLAVTPTRRLTGQHVPTLAGVYRRAWTLLVVNAVVMGVWAAITAWSVGRPLIDPDGSFLGPAMVRLPILCVGALLPRPGAAGAVDLARSPEPVAGARPGPVAHPLDPGADRRWCCSASSAST